MTVTATATVTETVSAVPTKTSEAPAAAASTPSIAPPAASRVAVPNGIGLNYQEAQDLWRAAGLHVAPAKDATGANRLPVLDSNWVVVAQDLKPGSKVTADSFITATVKKYTDD
ncbi:MAG TPA: PASTA domain-containing protein [Intrasporangium sp.]|nr:PASTA domain-containing protein [Intrasporangium sp.]